MSDLNEAILAKIQQLGEKLNDHDQRSALGMARSWINNGKLDTWNPAQHSIQVPNRDQLAVDLVTILETSGATREEKIEALAAAREWVNAPYFDPSMLGAQNRTPNLKPKEQKKESK